jgi:2,3-bisphosphoglycerate-dependent phosphoglycerate mutase
LSYGFKRSKIVKNHLKEGNLMKLVIIRHGESEWNKLNLFTGWKDVDLSPKGLDEARAAGRLLRENGYDFDICYTSYLKRAIHTLNYVLDEMDLAWLPVIKSWKLNERHYGALQGLNKSETAEKYGEDQVKIWRRSFDIRPPKLDEEDKENPRRQHQYREFDKEALPLCESLKDTINRVIPYYNETIKKDMLDGKRVLIAAHGNSIRSLVKYLDNLSEEEIIEVNIPTGIPLVYEFDNDFKVISKYYLGDQDTIKFQMEQVASQGKTK